MIDLASLHHALLVLEHGSFRAAATVLNVRPSAVSRRVRGLEDKIGVSLFQRQCQGARPTIAGERILARARAITDEIDLLVRSARLNGVGIEGRLCIGVVASFASGVARDLLLAFVEAHPDIDLEIVEGTSRSHIADVRALRMDATFAVGRPTARGCEVEPFWVEPILVAMASGHPLTAMGIVDWEQLSDEHFIVSKVDPGPEVSDFVVKHLGGLGRHPTVKSKPVVREGLMALIGLGRGISLVGTAEAGVTYPGVVFRQLRGEELAFSAVWSTLNDNPALRRFLSLARRRLAAQKDVTRPR